MQIKDQFNQSKFDKYVSYLKSKGLPHSSIRRKLSSLYSFQNYLVKNNYIKHEQLSHSKQNKVPQYISTKAKFSLPNFDFTKYLIISSILIILIGLGVGLYSQTITKAKKNYAYSSSSSPIRAGRTLSFQGRLTDTAGDPITSSTNINFKIFNQETAGVELYSTGTGNSQVVTPDSNGIFSVVIGKTHGSEIPNSVFTENSEAWLQITAGGETMNPRQQIATVGYAINAETLQGLPPSASGLKNTVLVIDELGNLNLGETSPTIKSTSGTMAVEGQSLLLKASDGSGGDIVINPDASGTIKLITEGTGSSNGFINASNANISTGNLFGAQINNNNRTYNFIEFKNYNPSTTNLGTRFSVSADGNVFVGATLSTTNLSLNNTLINSSADQINYLSSSSNTAGTIIYANGSGFANTSVGTSGWLLGSNGSGTPFWINPNSIGSTYFANNGIGLSASTFQLGGEIVKNTRLNIGNTESFYIQYNTGNISIGSTDPDDYKLNVSGDQYISGNLDVGGSITGNYIGKINFDQIRSATNINQNLIIGDGSTLTYTGTGVINASHFGGSTPDFYIGIGQTDNFVSNLSAGNGIEVSGSGIGRTVSNTGLIDVTNSTLIKSGTSANYTVALNLASTNTWTADQTFSNITVNNTFVSVGSTSLVSNLNAQYLNGLDQNNLPYVVNTSNSTLIRTGSGNSLSPYQLSLNLGSTNTWTALQTFNNGITVNNDSYFTNNVNIGGGVTISGNLNVGGTIYGTIEGNVGFDNLLSGTNTVANMTVGSGSSLSYTGTGVINASHFGGSSPSSFISIGQTADFVNIGQTAGFVGIGQTGNFITNLTAGSGVAISGAGIGRTINTSITNGLSYYSGSVGLGGNIIQDTQISLNSFSLSFLGLGSSQGLYLGSNSNIAIGTSNSTLAKLAVKSDNDIAFINPTNILTATGAFFNSLGWTLGSNWTISGGLANHSAGSTQALNGTSTATSTTTVYEITFDVGIISAGDGFDVALGSSKANETFTTPGQKTVYIKPTDSSGTISFIPLNSGNFVGNIDNVTIRSITQNSSTFSLLNSNESIGLEMRSGGDGLNNTFIGKNTGSNNISGNLNTSIGSDSLKNNISGFQNTSQGANSLFSNTSGYQNSTQGVYSLYSNTTGYLNTSQGAYSLYSNSSGSENTSIGVLSLFSNINGSNNTALGSRSLFSNTSGSYNIAIGDNAGSNLSVGSSNIFIGNNNGDSGSYSNRLYIGNNQNPIIYGDMTNGRIGLGTTNPLYKLQVEGDVRATSFRVDGNSYISKSAAAGEEDFAIITGGTERISITNTGDIGIGTTSPLSKFQISNGDVIFGYNQMAIGKTSTSTDLRIDGNLDVGGTIYGTIEGNVGFDNLLSGTNTVANMTVGSGSSLSYTGTGVINASHFGGSNPSSFISIGQTGNFISNITSGSGIDVSGVGIGRTIFNYGIIDSTNTTLTRSGTAGNYTLGLNLGSTNVWTAHQVFGNGIGVTGNASISGNLNVGGTIFGQFAGTFSGNLEFDQIISGINTSQNLVIGNGSTLTYSGTGMINASHLGGSLPSAFVNIGQTGSFVNIGQTGSFVNIGQTAGFVAIGQTGNFISNITSGSGIDVSGVGIGRTIFNYGIIDSTNTTLTRSGTAGNYTLGLNLGSTNVWTAHQVFGNGIGVTGNASISGNLNVGGTIFGTVMGTMAFNNITSGTNLSQNLIMGNGSSLSYTGTGVINASHFGGSAPSSYVGIGQTGSFVNIGQTAGFVGIGQTGNFITNLTGGSGVAISGTGIGRTISTSLGSGLGFVSGNISLGGPITQNTRLNIGNTEVLFVNYSTGRIGIGNTAPGNYKLYVTGSIATSGDFIIQGGDIYDNSGNLNLAGEDNVLFKLDYNNNDADIRAFIFGKNTNVGAGISGPNELMRINENGTVGIGISSPLAKLHLVGGDVIFGDTAMAVGKTTTSTDLRINGNVDVGGTIFGQFSGTFSGNLGFNQLISGTNTVANMTVGSGSSLSYTGAGVINASHFGGSAPSSYVGIGQTGSFVNIGQTAGFVGIGQTGNFISNITSGSGVAISGTGIGRTISTSLGSGLGFVSGNISLGGPITQNTRLNIGNTESLFINFSNGNVSLGNTAPGAYKLNITGSQNISANLRVGGTLSIPNGASNGYVLTSDASGNASWALNVGTTYAGNNGVTNNAGTFQLGGALIKDTRINIGNTEVAFFKFSNGNIGFGTTSPVSKIDILSPDASIRLRNINDTGGAFNGNTYNSYQIGLFNPTAGAWGNIAANTSQSLFGMNNNGVVGSLTNTFINAPVYRNVLDDGIGNMGIGTSDPQANLEIINAGTTGSIIRLSNTDTTLSVGQDLGQIEFKATDASTNGVGVMSRIRGVSNGTTNNFGNLSFQTRSLSNGAWNDTMFMASNGNVSIGNTSPLYRLHISTTGSTNAFVVATNGRVGIGNTGAYQFNVNGNGNFTTNLRVGATITLPNGASNGYVLTSDASGNGRWALNVGTTYTAGNAINITGGQFRLGGNLLENTTIGTSSFALRFTGLGNTEALYIGSNGRVAIGNTSPLGKLHVSIGNTQAFFINNSGSVGFGTTAIPGKFQISVGATHSFAIANNGNVAVGHTTPIQKLDVLGNLRLNGQLYVGNTATGFTGAPGFALVSTGTGLSWISPTGLGVTYSAGPGLVLSANEFSLNLGSTNVWSAPQNFNNSAYVSGRLGINTVTPRYDAEVGGVMYVTALGSGTSAAYQSFTAVGFPPSGFTTGVGNSAFVRDAATFFDTAGSARNGAVPDLGNAWMQTTVNMPSSGYVKYNWRVSSENTYDFLLVCVDRATCNLTNYDQRISGTVAWTEVVIPLTAGAHTVRWAYAKDTNTANGSDQGWVDNILFGLYGSGNLYVDGSVGIGNTSPLGKLQVNIGNTQALFISNNGNVAIGHTTPIQKLDVNGNLKLNGQLYVGNTATGFTGSPGQVLISTGTGLSWSTPASTAYTAGNGITLVGSQFRLGGNILENTTIGTSSFALRYIGLGNTEALYIGSNGRIGIGITAPLSKLHLVGGDVIFGNTAMAIGRTSVLTDLRIDGNLDIGGTIFGNIGFNNLISGTNTLANMTVGSGSSLSYTGTGVINASHFGGSLPSTFINIGQTANFLTIGQTGNFITNLTGGSGVAISGAGIGRTISTSLGSGLSFTSGNISLGGPITQNTRLNIGNTEVLFINFSNGRLGIGNTSPLGKLHVSIGNTQAFFIANNGNVAIGTTSPTGKFQVNVGNTASIFVSNNNGYVGIGTTNPGAMFEVAGSTGMLYTTSGNVTLSAGSSNVSFNNNNLINIRNLTVGNTLTITNGASNNYVLTSDASGNARWAINVGTTYISGNGITLVNGQFKLGGNLSENTTIGTSSFALRYVGLGNTEALNINSNGRVSIGTTNTSYSRFTIASLGTTATYGANLITNGSFAASTGWGLGANWAIAGGTLAHTAGSAVGASGTSTATSTTTTYQIGFTATTTTSSFQVSLGGKNSGLSIGTSGTASYFIYVQPINATGVLLITPSDANYVGNIDNIFIRPVTTYSPSLAILNSNNTAEMEIRTSNIGSGSTSPNIFIGIDSGKNNTTGSQNTSLGSYALSNNFTGTRNAALGNYALYSNSAGNENSAMGYRSLYSNISGDYNVAMGANSLLLNTSGYYNTAIGNYTLGNNLTGSNNSAIGNFAMLNNVNGNRNSALGNYSLRSNISGSDNSAFGNNSLYTNTTGSNNVALGNEALYNSNGSINVAIGYRAGYNLGTGSSNIFIGMDLNASGNFSNKLFIGKGANPIIYGDLSTGNVGFGTTNPSQKIFVDGGKVAIHSSSGSSGQLQIGNPTIGGEVGFQFISGASATGYGVGASSVSGPAHTFTMGINSYGIGSSNFGLGSGGARMVLTSGGNLGLSTTAPAYRLHVLGNAANGVAYFNNLTSTTAPTLTIGTSSTTVNATGAEFIRFVNNNGTTKAGRIRYGANTSSIVFATSGAGDLAEYVVADQPTEAGDLISFSDGDFTLSSTDKPLAGIHSSYATFVGNEKNIDKPNSFPLAIAGIVQLKVSSINGPIKKGDSLSASHLRGVAAKAIKSGYIAARALENYDNSDPNSTGIIEVIAGLNWYDPNMVITESGQINTNMNISPEVLASLGYDDMKNEIESATYSVTDSANQVVTTATNFAKASIAQLNAGLINAKNIIADNIIAKNIITQNLKVDLINPTGDTVKIGGNLDIENNLTAPTASIDDLKTNTLESEIATVSTLYADNIISKEGNFGDVLTSKVSSLRDEMKKLIDSTFATPSASVSNPIALEAQSWDFNPDSNSIEITGNMTLSDNLIIGSQLKVNGQTELADAYISGRFKAGEITIQNNIIETNNTALFIQPSGQGSINMLNGLFVAQTGEIQINGALKVNGQFTAQNATVSGSLIANMLKADTAEFNKLTTNEIKVATDSATGLVIADSLNNPIATTSATTKSNATAGVTTLPAGITQLTISTDKISPESMVYLTPNSSTNNQVPYVKSRTGESFTIAIDQPLASDVSLNWWIIN